MAEANEFVNVLKDQYPLDSKGYVYRTETIRNFWKKVEDLATRRYENAAELSNSNFISDLLWSTYDGLPQFKNDADAARYFANIIQQAIEKKPTALEIFKLERRIAKLESHYLTDGDIDN